MTCEESCILCPLSQLYKINYGYYHGLCKIHSQNQSKILRCLYCESIVPMLFLQDFICILCAKPLDEAEKNYGKSVCGECLNLNKSQGFAIIKAPVSNCDYCLKTPDILMYSISCKHFICQDCLKNQISCPLCILKHFGSPVSEEYSMVDEESKESRYKKICGSEKKPKSPYVIKYRRKLDFDMEKVRKSYNPHYNTVVPQRININPNDSEGSLEKSIDNDKKRTNFRIDLEKKTHIKNEIAQSSDDDNSIILHNKSDRYTQDTSANNNNSKLDHSSIRDEARRGEDISTTRVLMKRVLSKLCPCFYK